MDNEVKLPIMLSEDLRVAEGDSLQYVIQRRALVKGVEQWQSISFCTTLKSLLETARERLGDDVAKEARSTSNLIFDQTTIPEDILSLPEKNKRKTT